MSSLLSENRILIGSFSSSLLADSSDAFGKSLIQIETGFPLRHKAAKWTVSGRTLEDFPNAAQELLGKGFCDRQGKRGCLICCGKSFRPLIYHTEA